MRLARAFPRARTSDGMRTTAGARVTSGAARRAFRSLAASAASAAVLAPLVLTTVVLGGCGSDESTPKRCVPSTPDRACTPAYEPTFEQVFAKTLQPTCAKSGVSCHASTGKQGGLDFEQIEGAYENLVARQSVVANDPACSALVYRVTATDGKVRMPPGRSIDPGEQCAIITWIANGAKR